MYDTYFVIVIVFIACQQFLLNLFGALITFNSFTIKDNNIRHHAVNSLRNPQRSVPDISGFFAKNCPQQFFFRIELCFTFWSYFTDQNIFGPDTCTNGYNTAFIKILERFFAYIWNITSDLFFAQFCIAGNCIKNIYMNRCKSVFMH